MRFSFRTLIAVMIFVIFYTGYQGARYYMANRLQELGLLFAMILFFYGAFVTNLHIRDKDFKWNWWFFATIFFVCYTFILPGVVFSFNANVAAMPSIMASREFLMIFFGPAVYFLYRLGYDIRTIEKIFVISLIFLAFNYMFQYFRIDLRSAYFSPNPYLNGLVTFDPWRGYRLKPSSLALFMLSILAPFMLIISKSMLQKVGWFLVILLIGYIWALVQARSMAASLILSVLCYPFFFAKKNRLGLLFFVLPVLIIGTAAAISFMVEHMAEADPDGVRIRSYGIAWESIKDTPFLGFGQQSAFTKTEQQIFWYKFFSADLGLIGITFKYGFVGATIYVFFAIYLIKRTVTTLWLYKQAYNHINPVLYTLLIMFLTLFVNIILNPSLAVIPGITTATFAIGLTAAWRHKILTERQAADQ